MSDYWKSQAEKAIDELRKLQAEVEKLKMELDNSDPTHDVTLVCGSDQSDYNAITELIANSPDPVSALETYFEDALYDFIELVESKLNMPLLFKDMLIHRMNGVNMVEVYNIFASGMDNVYHINIIPIATHYSVTLFHKGERRAHHNVSLKTLNRFLNWVESCPHKMEMTVTNTKYYVVNTEGYEND